MKPLVMTVLGTRPEVIKLAPVVGALREENIADTMLCATAQHRDMLDVALRVFDLAPDIDLDLMRPSQQLHELTNRVIEAMTVVFRQYRPDLVVVQGDTTTALATTMAAFYERIPVAHVEAGLRTGDMDNPFPEEMNRRVIGSIAALHFAPTERARQALLREGMSGENVVVTGNTVIDALLHTVRRLPAESPPARRTILITAHRRESFGSTFDNIFAGLRRFALRNPEIALVYPVHRNPRVLEPVSRYLADLPNVRLCDPMGYEDFVRAMRDAYFILTDSGGVQEEAPSLGKPVLVMRETTERPEAIEAGTALLVGTDPERIVETCERLLCDDALYHCMATARNPFGDGLAGKRIAAAIGQWLQCTSSRAVASEPA